MNYIDYNSSFTSTAGPRDIRVKSIRSTEYLDQAGNNVIPVAPLTESLAIARRDAGDYKVTTGTQIFVCNDIVQNIGSDYDGTDGKYTAPATGAYQVNFHCSIVRDTSGACDGTVDIRVGGAVYSNYFYDLADTAIETILTMSEVVYASANDEIYVQINHGTGDLLVIGTNYNQLSIKQLS